MKKLFFCTAALLAAISFSACFDEDDDEENNLPATSTNIVGTWQITHTQGWEIYNGEKESWSDDYPDEEGYYWTNTFDQNGTGEWIEYNAGEKSDTSDFTYSISGNKLTISFAEDDDNITYEIKKLTESQLILYYGTKSEDSTEIYKRIE